MNPPNAGLRPLFNKSNSAVRVELIIKAGDHLEVSDDVASQLPTAFAPSAGKKAAGHDQAQPAAGVGRSEIQAAPANPGANGTAKKPKG